MQSSTTILELENESFTSSNRSILEDAVPTSTFEALKHMISNKAYIFLVLAVSGMFFIVTNIQFWMSDYMELIFDADPKLVKKIFMFVCLTSPTLGAVCVSCVPTNWDRYWTCLGVGLLAAFAGIQIPITTNFWYAATMVWIYLFFGGIMLPLLTLCILGVVEPELRPRAQALANVSYNGLGYMPATMIYGIACDMTGGTSSKWGMIVTLLINFPVAFSVFLAIYFKPNVEELLDERREQLAENYINRNELQSVNDLNERFNSLDNQYSRIHSIRYGSRLTGNIGLTDALLPGYTENSSRGGGSQLDSRSNSMVMSFDGRLASRANRH